MKAHQPRSEVWPSSDLVSSFIIFKAFSFGHLRCLCIYFSPQNELQLEIILNLSGLYAVEVAGLFTVHPSLCSPEMDFLGGNRAPQKRWKKMTNHLRNPNIFIHLGFLTLKAWLIDLDSSSFSLVFLFFRFHGSLQSSPVRRNSGFPRVSSAMALEKASSMVHPSSETGMELQGSEIDETLSIECS